MLSGLWSGELLIGTFEGLGFLVFLGGILEVFLGVGLLGVLLIALILPILNLFLSVLLIFIVLIILLMVILLLRRLNPGLEQQLPIPISDDLFFLSQFPFLLLHKTLPVFYECLLQINEGSDELDVSCIGLLEEYLGVVLFACGAGHYLVHI